MTTLTMRYIKGDFVVTGPDIEPTKFKTRREAKEWCRRITLARRSRRSSRFTGLPSRRATRVEAQGARSRAQFAGRRGR